MKQIRLVWNNKVSEFQDDILLLISEESGLEIAQLRRSPESKRRSPKTWADAYADRSWLLRAVHYDDNVISQHLGPNWDSATYNGFRTVREFESWLKNREDRENVRQKNY